MDAFPARMGLWPCCVTGLRAGTAPALQAGLLGVARSDFFQHTDRTARSHRDKFMIVIMLRSSR